MQRFLGTIAAALIAVNPLVAADRVSPSSLREIETSYDQSAETARVTLPVRDGRMYWDEFFRGLARVRGFDDEALRGIWPQKSVRVAGLRGRVVLAGINRLFGPGIHAELVAHGKTGNDCLELTLDHRALLASERRFKQRIEKGLQRVRPSQHQYGLVFDDRWSEAPPEKNLVVLVHGLQSAAGRIGGVLEDIRKSGFPCATFDYPNDQPIEISARLLAEQLAAVAKDRSDRKLTLITHSMGGLVARAVVENEELDPGNVEQLIMVAPPNHGSLLAHFAFGFDFWEYLKESREQKLTERFFAAIEDGLGEAPDDLRPGSSFLEELNSRPRNANVRYTILLGTAAPLSDMSLQGLRLSLKTAGKRNRFVRFLGSKLDGYLADMDEVVRGKGDGAVAVKRGRLEGVPDTEELEFDHLDFSAPQDSPGATLIREAILKRLGQ